MVFMTKKEYILYIENYQFRVNMFFGKTDREKWNKVTKGYLWFAWYPVKCADGRWIWLETLKVESFQNFLDFLKNGIKIKYYPIKRY